MAINCYRSFAIISLCMALLLMTQCSLQGIGIWRLGLEDPMYWKIIPKKIKVKKVN
ncbi:hypothetical protein [Neobacillus jeddahensis]|uniref:hypothetical protein n=1 Tax=Neobacillus jeddahensis TaxID=1461580 RepID=UPI0012ED59F9|nr:hypothetical protein [Neobacillus jeddahensis]